jgi:hypothetical protein
MSAYADLDLATPERKSRGKKLKSNIVALADDARERFDLARERGMELAGTAGSKAAAHARTVAGHAKQRPVSTGLIVAAVGVGLLFLLSRSARSRAVSYSEDLWNRYGRR